MGIDYQARKAAILASNSIDELKRTQNMPPVPACKDDENFVFISYSHMDYKAVYCDLLEFHKNGLRYWYDEGLPAGEDWDKVVESQIKHPRCAGVIFYMSENLFLSKSVNREVEFTVGGGEADAEGKNYFCINISDGSVTGILKKIIRTYDDDALEKYGIDERMTELLQAFSNKSTYIPKSGDADEGHIAQTLLQIKKRFGVFADGTPIENVEEVQKLAKELELAKSFAIKDGVLLKYLGEGGEVVIPKKVISIADEAFRGCKSLTSITILNSVTSIGVGAFAHCAALTSITIPDSVTSIDDGAFMGCTALKNITIPDSVTSIGFRAFGGCTALTDITIPNSVTSIGDGAFRGCSSLESIVVEDGNSIYHSAGNCLIETATGTLCVGCKNSVIPDDGSVTSIGKYAFLYCNELREKQSGICYVGDWIVGCDADISVPVLRNNTRGIADGAFFGCTKLTNITIPDSVTSIGNRAFAYCTSLTKITIPDSVTSIGYDAFSGCAALTNITIPNSVKSIGDDTFANCTALTDITIPNSVTSIGDGAFMGCESLTSITIPNSVTGIGLGAFDDCMSLTNITYDGTMAQWEAIEKEDEWNDETGDYVVHCTDGDIRKGEA